MFYQYKYNKFSLNKTDYRNMDSEIISGEQFYLQSTLNCLDKFIVLVLFHQQIYGVVRWQD